MGTLRACTVTEQNANTLAGIQVDTALFGSAVAGATIRAGREAPVYVLAGTQTSSLAVVVLDLVNAAAGDRLVVKKVGTGVIGTGLAQIDVRSGSASGAIVGSIGTAAGTSDEVVGVFDGVQWR